MNGATTRQGTGRKSITDRPEMHPINEIRKVWLHKLELTIEAEAGLERVKSRSGSLVSLKVDRVEVK